MSDKGQSAGETFDLDRLKQLIRLMEKHDLTEVKLESGDQKWVLRRGPRDAAPAAFPIALPPGAYPAIPTGPPPTSVDSVVAGGAAAPAASSDDGLIEITSPTVGTFYGAPQPGDPEFVKIGDRVSPETVVCIVEAMKVFNQIPAEVSGTISQLLVKDGEGVEFGQALFRVTPG